MYIELNRKKTARCHFTNILKDNFILDQFYMMKVILLTFPKMNYFYDCIILGSKPSRCNAAGERCQRGEALSYSAGRFSPGLSLLIVAQLLFTLQYLFVSNQVSSFDNC